MVRTKKPIKGPFVIFRRGGEFKAVSEADNCISVYSYPAVIRWNEPENEYIMEFGREIGPEDIPEGARVLVVDSNDYSRIYYRDSDGLGVIDFGAGAFQEVTASELGIFASHFVIDDKFYVIKSR